MTFTRTVTNIKGTPGSPVSVAAAAPDTATLAVASGGTLAEAVLMAEVNIGSSAPTTAPTLQPQYSLDGTNYYSDGGPYVVPITATSTSYDYTYRPPAEAVDARWALTNGATNAITWTAQGSTLGIS